MECHLCREPLILQLFLVQQFHQCKLNSLLYYVALSQKNYLRRMMKVD